MSFLKQLDYISFVKEEVVYVRDTENLELNTIQCWYIL